MTTLKEALLVVAAADPKRRIMAEHEMADEIRRAEQAAAVAGVDFSEEIRPRSAPSFGGQDPRNAAALAQREKYHLEGLQAAEAARQRTAAQINKDLEHMAAGQSAESAAAILSRRVLG